jgi:putative hemolysin
MDRPDILARAGRLEVRLAATPHEIRAAQSLRYRVFFEEGGAAPEAESRNARRDICRFDDVCDHILAVEAGEVVGAYRLLRGDVAARMELGRSCVAEGFRGKRTLETLWRGVWAYALNHGVDAMFGCASFPGADARPHAAALAALSSVGATEPEWRVAPSPGSRRAALPPPATLDLRAAIRDLPPLVKGYLRLGARFGTDAVIDETFGTTDVFVLLRVVDIQARYLQHFAPEQPIAA